MKLKELLCIGANDWCITAEAADWVPLLFAMTKAPFRSPGLGLVSLSRTFAVLAVALASCASNPSDPNGIDQTEAIKRLDYRLQQLERRVGDGSGSSSEPNDKTPPGPVKSLTLRLGSLDDRLRIYWEDGTTTNLPCTEEQKTWVCG